MPPAARLKLEKLVLGSKRALSGALGPVSRRRTAAAFPSLLKVRVVHVEAKQQCVVFQHRRQERVVAELCARACAP